MSPRILSFFSDAAALAFCFMFLLCSQSAFPQDPQPGPRLPGTPPFNSLEGPPDHIDQSNLNQHIVIPVFSKAGRGMGVSSALIYDTTQWVLSQDPNGGSWDWNLGGPVFNGNSGYGSGWQITPAIGSTGYVISELVYCSIPNHSCPN